MIATKKNAENLYFWRIDKRILKISRKLLQILGLLEHSAISRSLMSYREEELFEMHTGKSALSVKKESSTQRASS